MAKILFTLLLTFVCSVAAFAQGSGQVRGRVVDPNGAVIPGCTVTFTDPKGHAEKGGTDAQGEFRVRVTAAKYSLRVDCLGFVKAEKQLQVASGSDETFDFTLAVQPTQETVLVETGKTLNTDPENNASAIVLGKDELKSLPDNPAELEAMLQALAGSGAGPDGGEIFIDGFSGGKMPKKETIREVRINQNPFSSEYDRPGFGRIEILTKPGTEDWHGEVSGEFEDESLNARNPFSPNRPPYQLRNQAGEVSGPLLKNKVSIFTDLEREAVDNNLVVNAFVLGPGLAPTQFQRAFTTSSTNWDFGQRVDAQLGKNHTIVARYSRETFRSPHNAYGGFELPSVGWASNNREWFIRLTETAVVTPTVVNETRFQFFRINEAQEAVDPGPTIRVLDAFTSGGSVGHTVDKLGRHELANITSIVKGVHIIRTGIRIRKQSIDNTSPTNFAGSFTFTSLEQYRNTILNLPGAYPTQFLINGGEPRETVSRWDAGIFMQDDVRYRPDITLSYGLRYERQNFISSNYDVAPRLAIAYAPGAGAKTSAKTVIRAGLGVFYDRFNQSQMIQVKRFNGVKQLRFVVTDPAILDTIVFTANGVTNIPNVQTLSAFRQAQTIRIADPALRSPYTIQAAISIERQFPFKTTVSISYINAHAYRLFRSTNINGPVDGVRPQPSAGNIFRYESNGRLVQNQVVVNFKSNPSKHFSLFGNYSFGFAKSDTEGTGTFPANANDLKNEFGPSGQDVRHRITMGFDIGLPFGIGMNPFITARSSVPFNITTGTDLNGDTLFTDRPSFASAGEAGVVVTRFGTFDPTPETGDIIIPRNYGRGPVFFQFNLNFSKTFHFARPAKKDDDDENEGKYQLELGAQIRNIFNRVNLGFPIGNLSSSLFGQSVSAAGGAVGNRRVVLEGTFRF